jgi:hypothetical protein
MTGQRQIWRERSVSRVECVTMIHMLTIDGTQHGCYTTKADAVAALTRLRAEGEEGDAQIRQIDYDHDAEVTEKMQGGMWS